MARLVAMPCLAMTAVYWLKLSKEQIKKAEVERLQNYDYLESDHEFSKASAL